MTEKQWGTRNTYPPNWKQIRLLVAERAGQQCQDLMRDGIRCTDLGTECDHINNIKAGGTHELENLQWLCKYHHRIKTNREAQDARKQFSMWRKPEAHPGML